MIHIIALQLLVLQPTVTRREEEAPSLKSLIADPYILIASGKAQKETIYHLHNQSLIPTNPNAFIIQLQFYL